MPKLNDIMAARPAEKRPQYTVQMIPYTQLIPNRENKYSLGEIEELANMIRLAGGISEPLFARKRAPGEYELISGHRRRLAVIHLVEKLGLEQFRLVPVHLENLDDIMARVTLYIANAGQRNKTDHDRMIEVVGLTESLESLRTGTPEHQEKFRELTGLEPQFAQANDIRAAVAEKLGLSVTKTAQLKHINNKLEPELKEKFERQEIGYSAADKAASLPPESQRELAQKERISIKDVKEKSESDFPAGKEQPERALDSASSCPPKISSCIRQNWGTSEKDQEEGRKECAVCWKHWKVLNEPIQAEAVQEQQDIPEEMLPGNWHQAINGHAKAPEAPVKTGHVMKVGAEEYDRIIRGEKAYKLTKNEQKFSEGHDLELWCYKDGKFTGRKAETRISYMDEDIAGLKDGYCILGFQLISWNE